MNKIRSTANIDELIYHYPRYFDKPSEVLEESGLSDREKIKLLKQWKQDAELQQIAEEENMRSFKPIRLQEIIDALHKLGYFEDTEDTPPTKLGGI